MKLLAVIDKKASAGFEFVELNAKEIVTAMAEADTLMNETVYLIKIVKKVGKIEKVDNLKTEKYEAVITNRGNGWHVNDYEHGEGPLTVRKYTTLDLFQIEG